MLVKLFAVMMLQQLSTSSKRICVPRPGGGGSSLLPLASVLTACTPSKLCVWRVDTVRRSPNGWRCLQDKMLSMAVANHVLWPLAKFINAQWVPKQHQPVANKLVQVSPCSLAG